MNKYQQQALGAVCQELPPLYQFSAGKFVLVNPSEMIHMLKYVVERFEQISKQMADRDGKRREEVASGEGGQG